MKIVMFRPEHYREILFYEAKELYPFLTPSQFGEVAREVVESIPKAEKLDYGAIHDRIFAGLRERYAA